MAKRYIVREAFMITLNGVNHVFSPGKVQPNGEVGYTIPKGLPKGLRSRFIAIDDRGDKSETTTTARRTTRKPSSDETG